MEPCGGPNECAECLAVQTYSQQLQNAAAQGVAVCPLPSAGVNFTYTMYHGVFHDLHDRVDALRRELDVVLDYMDVVQELGQAVRPAEEEEVDNVKVEVTPTVEEEEEVGIER